MTPDFLHLFRQFLPTCDLDAACAEGDFQEEEDNAHHQRGRWGDYVVEFFLANASIRPLQGRDPRSASLDTSKPFRPIKGDWVSPFTFSLEGLQVDLTSAAETATFKGRSSLPTHGGASVRATGAR